MVGVVVWLGGLLCYVFVASVYFVLVWRLVCVGFLLVFLCVCLIDLCLFSDAWMCSVYYFTVTWIDVCLVCCYYV